MQRTFSQDSAISSESDEEMVLFPITDLTGSEGSDSDQHKDNYTLIEKDEKPKALMSLRQRRQNRPTLTLDNINQSNCSNAKFQWISAVRKTRQLSDPWAEFHIADLETEVAIRHRYNALKKSWTTDEVFVKMEPKPFNRGAMRQCFRLKKLSNFANEDWEHSMNYVAKRYIEDVSRSVYFEDIRLQMDAKLWGEEYDRHNPPKKVDIFQLYALEMKNREGSPIFHLEHYIEGQYIKYNSNSGFVEETLRMTPQAFSHFTFERSGHQLIIVDIQGVGDLYTDPQLHTADGKDYGDGNLGPKGMALFFYSHRCNSICKSLGLTPFDLSPTESGLKNFTSMTPEFGNTVIRGTEELCRNPISKEINKFFSQQRSLPMSISESFGSPSSSGMNCESEEDPLSPDSSVGHVRIRLRYSSESESTTMTEEERREAFARRLCKARCSSVWQEKIVITMNEKKIGDSILGKIHHEMAKYHEIGRFSGDPSKVDWTSALYHEEHAASLGVLEAIITMAKIYLDRERNVLVDAKLEPSVENIDSGLEYMECAAEAGDRSAMLHMADSFYSGLNLGSKRTRNWSEAYKWYQRALDTCEADEGGEYDSTMDYPLYTIHARQAEMLRHGGYELDKQTENAGNLYTEAAEGAMAAMKGRLANEFYELAEECYGEMEDE